MNICRRVPPTLRDLRDRVLRILRGGEGQAPKIPSGAVVCADDLPPSRFLEIDWSGGGGLALLRGSPDEPRRDAGARARHSHGRATRRRLPTSARDGAARRRRRDARARSQRATQVRLFETRRESHRKSRAPRARDPAAADRLVARREDHGC